VPKGVEKPVESKPKPGAKPALKPLPSKDKPAKPVAKPVAKPAPGKAPKRPGSKGEPAKPTRPEPRPLAEALAAAKRLAAAAGLAPVQPTARAADVTASDKKRLTKTPLSKPELKAYRDLLIQKRDEIAGDVSSMETEALTGGGSGSLSNLPQHMADQGSDVYDQALSLDLAASQRKLLIEIDAALERIADGTYGICIVTGQPIGKARLDAKPWAKLSIEAARMQEHQPYHHA
jgi:DnaK suppressor protein